jgi:hypothetical protein
LGNRTARKSLNSHSIILLIIFGLGTQLIDVPFYLNFIIHSGVVQPSVPSVCIIWWIVAFALYNGQQILMAWTSIERHIFIFHDNWMKTSRGRFFGHYLPLIVILSYIIIFYGYAFFIYPCENDYEYTLPVCNAYPCYQDGPIIGFWDFIGNNILPGLIVAFVSMALLARVVRRKQRLSQGNQWRKNRKMTIQLLLISILNIIFILPLNLLSLAHLCGLSSDSGAQIQLYLYFTAYLLIFFIPFVCLASMPELLKKIKLILHCQRRTPVVGMSVQTNRQ